MATLTTNLFHGIGEFDTELDVIEGHWPNDISGAVFVVGPDKRAPGGHWFGAHGLLCRIDCAPTTQGRIAVRAARVHTPLERLSQRWPKLFKTFEFAQFSPFGVTNMANTNVEPIDGRLFIGFDAGRPLEVDPETLEYLTPVGSNSEWLQAMPAPFEPLVSVAAHPASAHEERAMYFVNYSPLPGDRQTSVARWGLGGPVERWPLAGTQEFDSIHDIKASTNHLVISDLPFVVEPEAFKGGERKIANQDVTRLFIVAKADLRATPPGSPVPVVEVTVPMPTGHISVASDDTDGVLTIYCEHIPMADLMMRVTDSSVDHRNGERFDPEYEGLVTLSVQPGVVGRYRIDAATGEVLDAETAWDDRFWGSILTAKDQSSPEARAEYKHLWFAGLGFDPDLITEAWWKLYVESGNTALVPLPELPTTAKPGALAHFDLESMKVTEVFEFADGAFPSPPTFVPRRDSDGPGDGYVVVLVHKDGDKEIQVFDAHDLERGPLARASAPGFNPPLLLHSCWMPDRPGPRPSTYRVPVWKDVVGAVTAIPRVTASSVRTIRKMAKEQRVAR